MSSCPLFKHLRPGSKGNQIISVLISCFGAKEGDLPTAKTNDTKNTWQPILPLPL